jgi:aryl-phospho-beta-D-glucosidase BglC (GH1 family)
MTLRYALLAILLHAGLIWSADALLFEKGTQLPWLRVDGKVITDSTGRPVRLVGHGISPINPGEWNKKSIQKIVAQHKAKGLNSMRVAFYRNNDYDQTRDQIKELGPEQFIDKWIEPQVFEIIRNGMYAIVDWHGYENQHDFLYSELIPLWVAIAKRYKNEPGVAIYELWNEPNCGGSSGADSLRTWYKNAITSIRKIDTQHIIMVSDWNAGWGWAIEQMWAPHGVLIDIDPLTKKQIVYSKHMSAINERKGDGVDADNFSRKYDVPVFWGEVETDPNVNKISILDQHVLFKEMVDRLLKNHLCQGVQFWRIYDDAFEIDWKPLVGAGCQWW